MMRVTVPSTSKAGQEWEVEYADDSDRLICSCPRYVTSPRDSKGCGHTDIVVRCDSLLQKCAEIHGTNDGGLCRVCLVALLAISVRHHKSAVHAAEMRGRKTGREQASKRRKKR